MTNFEALRIAFTALLQNRMRALLTTLGIIIGVSAVIALVTLGQGVENYIHDQFQSLGANLLIVTSQQPSSDTRSRVEPLTNLDANLREEMRFEIKDLRRRTGVTILYVTHDQEVALAISDRIGIMGKDGSLRQIGDPHAIYTNPDDGFVFNFLGVANFIPVERRNGAVHIRGSDLPLRVEIPSGVQERIARDEMVAACRPFEIDLTRDGGVTRGRVRRRVFLGPIVTYFITVGQVEIRAQQEAAEAFLDGRALEEGEACGITFQALRWYDRASVGTESA